jgi:hypothetical protein
MTPVPDGRGRWRLTLHRRAFTPTPWQVTMLAELSDARSRQLTQAWNAAAQLTFTMDGSSSQAMLVQELATDVIAWRWSESLGRDVAMFRGLIDHSEDEVSAESAVTNFVCHDYFALMNRRILTANQYAVTNRDQDSIVQDLLTLGTTTHSSSGTSFSPGAWQPLTTVAAVNPDGTSRAASGQLRTRTYLGSTVIMPTISDLAAVINGFEFAISGLTRTVDSTEYANYVRVLGNNQSSDPNAAQVFAEIWNSDANNIDVNPVGLWMDGENAADVTLSGTLSDQAAGDLNLSGLLVPSYTVTMRPDAYHYGFPNMGDTVPLIVKTGRLNVNTTVRVLGFTFDIGDDGEEDVSLTLGRPAAQLAKFFTQSQRDIDALVRR